MFEALHVPSRPIRVVTAAALFDGHDAAINIMRRILQGQGAEVIHLGHDRSVEQIATAAVQEDADAIAISSYQGGHVEFFEYLVSTLAERGAGHVRVYGGGGGTIVAEEIEYLHGVGVARIFSPEDGQRLGLATMVNTILAECDARPARSGPGSLAALAGGDVAALARLLTRIEAGAAPADELSEVRARAAANAAVTLGITGTGGAGKSSLTDELIRRLRVDQADKLRTAVLAIDPSRRRGGGALLGDRIRMNSLDGGPVFFRSLATRGSSAEVPVHVPDMVAACAAAGFDLVIVETPGIGQGDAAIGELVDVSLYVMTAEFGAASQLEKIEMLDVADVVAINKFERRGSDDARRDVARQLVRNRAAFGIPWQEMPVFGTSAASFADDGVTALYQHLRLLLTEKGLPVGDGTLPIVETKVSTGTWAAVPAERVRYLAEVAETVRGYHQRTDRDVGLAEQRALHRTAAVALDQHNGERLPESAVAATLDTLRTLADEAERAMHPDSLELLTTWPDVAAGYVTDAAGHRPARHRTTLSGTPVPRVALPRSRGDGELLRFLRSENLPGFFPFTSGVFPFKREGEEPARMFAGEGDPFRTNRRFHLLSEGQPATRLSTAFDSVTLYGRDPDERPDVYGKVGTSGVSIATLDDMKALYAGFDLCAPTTSVSMTINGPAPTILAFFLNTVLDQAAEQGIDAESALRTVRGTVQADILKEDQGQNTCIFSTEFSLRMMADIQQWFIEHGVRNFYSVSISGYHIAEAGANPISQLAFTLANGFTYVESYLARGMAVDDFAPNLSFFFSNGMDAEYTVLGRVARRIWAVAMRDKYGANERSQKLKYHVQTSGRSLHAQEMAFNDIRTTLQALCALYDNANSLHTNAYDEAVTTPSEESVRRALAIQLIINREWGLAMNENPLQGSFIVDELTDLVEQAVLAEFDNLTARGGVLGAMETGYQRGKIQDESLLYEQRKHDGTLPIVGVNTFRGPSDTAPADTVQLARGTEQEKQSQLARLRDFHEHHADDAADALDRLHQAVLTGSNVFAELMHAARVCSLGQITDAFYQVGGQYRRNV